MLAMVEKVTDYTHDIAYYAKDSRLTEPSDGKRYEWRVFNIVDVFVRKKSK